MAAFNIQSNKSSPKEEWSDEYVAQKVQAGDKEVFGLFVERYEAKLLRYGRKFLARGEDIEDMVQEVFINAYQNIQSFDPQQKFSSWIYRIAHNAYVNALKKNSRLPFILFDFDTVLSHHVYEDPAEALRDQTDMRRMVERGLEELSANYREVLVLYYLEELGYKEIADILHIPTGTVGIRLRRAKESLRAVYEKLHIHHGA